MKKRKAPLLEEITLDNVVNNCKKDFHIKKGEFEQEIFRTSGRLTRIRRGISRLDNTHINDIISLLRQKTGSEEKFVAQMQKWFPSLKEYADAARIVEIFRANLLGTAVPVSEVCDDLNNDLNSKDFLVACLQSPVRVKKIKMAFHSGWEWLDNRERTALLTDLAQKCVEIQVVVNFSTPTMTQISAAMKDPAKKMRYAGLDESLRRWHSYENEYKNITLRISEYPILRHLVIAEYEDGTARSLVRDYIYGSPVKSYSPHRQVYSSSPDYSYLDKEFTYLWANGRSFDQWQASLPAKTEQMNPAEYYLLYPTHNPNPDAFKWIYSKLTIEKDNRATLKVNIGDPLRKTVDSERHEYAYTGDLTVTRHNVFLHLVENLSDEVVSITLTRPPRDNGKYIGVLSGISPSGLPVAFKCACFTYELLEKVDFQRLIELLGHHNRDWSDNMMIVADRDVNYFDSDQIFKRL